MIRLWMIFVLAVSAVVAAMLLLRPHTTSQKAANKVAEKPSQHSPFIIRHFGTRFNPKPSHKASRKPPKPTPKSKKYLRRQRYLQDECDEGTSDKPVLEVLSDPDAPGPTHPEAVITLRQAVDIAWDFFLKNGPETGVYTTPFKSITKDEFIKHLLVEWADEPPPCGTDYWFRYENYHKDIGEWVIYRLKVSAIDGTVTSLNYGAWEHIGYGDGPNQARSKEEALKVLKRMAKITLEEGKQIALAFIRRNYPNFKEEEFDLVVCKVKLYGDAGWDCFYEYDWRRKEKLPGYAVVYPTMIGVCMDPGSGLIEHYCTWPFDWKVREPPKVSKEEAVKMARLRVRLQGRSDYDLTKPDVVLTLEGSLANPPRFPTRLIWYIQFSDPNCEGCCRRIKIDAHTGEILEDIVVP